MVKPIGDSDATPNPTEKTMTSDAPFNTALLFLTHWTKVMTSGNPKASDYRKLKKCCASICQGDNQETSRMYHEAALQIDPKTAEVDLSYAIFIDPNGEPYSVVREYFARAPGSDLWVVFDVLPDAIRDALWEKHSCHD